MSKPARTVGQFLLRRTCHPAEWIARRLGCSRSLAGQFKSGTRTPGPEHRLALFDHYRIPPEAWDQPHGGAL